MSRSPAVPASLSTLGSLVMLGLLAACSVSASTSTQSGSAPPAGDSGSGTGKPALVTDQGAAPGAAADPGAAPAGGPGAPAPAACTPALADMATSLFAGRVVVKLPKGVELVEQNPFYAQSAAPQQATSCGAPVRYAAVGFFEWPANASITQVRDQLLELRGIPLGTLTWSEEGTRGRHYTAAYSAAQDPATQAPATHGWVVLRDAPNDKYAYFAVFETDEASWTGLRAVFQDAGRNLFVKPKALQGPPQVAPAPKEEPKPKKKPKAKAAIKPAP